MNRNQQRRLEAVEAAVPPCSGCVVEDIRTAKGLWESEARGEHIWQIHAEHDRERNEPVFKLVQTEEEVRRRSQACHAEMQRLDAQLRSLSQLPQAARRDACPRCVPRKRFREDIVIPW